MTSYTNVPALSQVKMVNKDSFFYNVFVKPFDKAIENKYDKEIAEAQAAKDANRLDLALRSKYHMMHRGQEVDTSSMKFTEVVALDPKFYPE